MTGEFETPMSDPAPTQVVVGLAGAGFVARLHIEGWRKVAGVDVVVRGVAAAHPERAQQFASEFDLEVAYEDFDGLLADPAVTVVDLGVPNNLHEPFAIAALRAGKHVIVEKPLTGCFTPRADMTADAMQEEALRSAGAMLAAADAAGRQLCYAENWLYAPPFVKAERLLAAAGGTILRMQGEESHSGTHSEPNKHWVTAGGGALLGKGCHPLAAVLYLKAREGHRAQSVIAQTASLTKVEAFARESPQFLRTGYEDVEDWGSMLVTFTDGSVAEVSAADTTLGGVRNRLTVFASNAVVEANLNPNTAVRAYAPDATVF
ncbi:MAG TPA: Gfo/Idh/MocA family oxidoreductase, partial [Acidimicrobiia bacterium]|nr:Gfo/Idh/MocA family oxidoreductase [Acidimicrobiia bacterium]